MTRYRLNCGEKCRNPADCSKTGKCMTTGATLVPELHPISPEQFGEVEGLPSHEEIESTLRRVAIEAIGAAPDSKGMGRFRDAFTPEIAIALLDQAKAGDELAEVVQRKLGPASVLCPSCKGDKRADPSAPLEFSACETCGGLGTVPSGSIDAFAARHGVSPEALERFKRGVAALDEADPPRMRFPDPLSPEGVALSRTAAEGINAAVRRRLGFEIDAETSLYTIGAFLRDKDLRLEVRSNGETWLAIAAEQLDDGERSRGLSPVHAGPTGAIVAALSGHLKTPSWMALEDDARIEEDDQLRPNPPAPMMRLLAFSRLAREEGRTVRQFRLAFGEASGVYRKGSVQAAAVPVRTDNDELLRALGKAAREGAAAELPPELAEALGPDFEERVVDVLLEKLSCPECQTELNPDGRCLNRYCGLFNKVPPDYKGRR